MTVATDWASSDAGRAVLPEVGETELTGEELTPIVYTAAADSPPQEKLDFVTGWAGQTPSIKSTETPTCTGTDT